MSVIPESQITRDTSKPNRWFAEASSIGLAPGQWPPILEVQIGDAVCRFGSPRTVIEPRDHELLHVTYYSHGKVLIVHND